MADGNAGGSHPPELGADGDLDTAGGGKLPPKTKFLLQLRIANDSPAVSKHLRKLQALAKYDPQLRKRMQEVLFQANYVPTPVGFLPWPLEADWVLEMEKELLNRGQFCALKFRLDPDMYCGFVPDWTIKKRPWEEFVVKVLHIVRLHQIKEFDPVQGYHVYTRFCRYNLAFFNFEKESKAERGTPFHKLTSYDHKFLEGSVNVVSLKIHESKVGYPIRVFGTVLVRDQVDYKCVYLFRRGKNDPQLVNSPNDMLTLTDPCRGLAVTASMYFEINLKIEGDSGEIIFSKGVIEHDACLHEKELETKLLTSWHSTVRLDYTPVPFALIATITVRVLSGSNVFNDWTFRNTNRIMQIFSDWARGDPNRMHDSDVFNGEITAWTSGNENKITLHDSKVEGTSTELGDGGSVILTRRLIAVPVDEKLVVQIRVQDATGREAKCFVDALGPSDDCRTFYQDPYALRVEVEWTGNTKRRNVYKYVGRDIKLLV